MTQWKFSYGGTDLIKKVLRIEIFRQRVYRAATIFGELLTANKRFRRFFFVFFSPKWSRNIKLEYFRNIFIGMFFKNIFYFNNIFIPIFLSQHFALFFAEKVLRKICKSN